MDLGCKLNTALLKVIIFASGFAFKFKQIFFNTIIIMKPTPPHIPDAELIEAIKTDGSRRDAALKVFLEDEVLKAWIIGIARRYKGTLEDGEELFSETARIFAQNIVDEKFRGESSLKTYFVGIAQKEWLNMYRKKERLYRLEVVGNDATTAFANAPSDLFDGNTQVLQEAMQDIILHAPIGQRCKDIMVLSIQQYKNHEIEAKTGSTDAARDRYKCHLQFVAYVKSHPHILAQLKASI